MDPARFLDEFRPFRRGELALARRLERDSAFLPPPVRDLLRYALRLAALSSLGPEPDALVDRIGSFRLRLLQFLAPVLPTDPARLSAEPLVALSPKVEALVAGARERIAESGLAHADALDRELSERKLALVLGGAAGSGYAYAGALAALERAGLAPSYLVGCSIGAILAIVRARRARFDLDELCAEVRRLRQLGALRPTTESRFGLPAALRLDLHRALGGAFAAPDGTQLRLRDLPIAVDTLATGVGPGALGRPRAEYARLVDVPPATGSGLADLGGRALARVVGDLVALAMSRQVLVPVFFGADAETAELPAVDAAGFSAAIPAILQYEPEAADARSEALLDGIFQRHALAALVDGALVSALPARYAFEALEGGRIGTRNAVVVALDALESRSGASLLLGPLQRVIAATAHRDAPFWDLRVPFHGAPSMLALFPRESDLRRTAARAEREFEAPLRLLRELLAPLPPWRSIRTALGAPIARGGGRW